MTRLVSHLHQIRHTNIREHMYKQVIPEHPLSEFIDCLWISSGIETKEKILPNGFIDLVFNLGSPYKLIDTSGNEHIFRKSWVAGMQKSWFIVEPNKTAHLAGIRFKAGGAFPFFKFPISEISFKFMDIDNLMGSLIEDTRSQLYDAKKDEARFTIMENVLFKRINGDMKPDMSVKYAIQAIKESEDVPSISEISEDIGISHKHLISIFHQKVGVAPKLLYRINKFNAVLNSVRDKERVNWTEVAYSCNYYDQSHLNYDFRKFAGTNPGTYFKHKSSDGQRICVA